MSNLYASYIFLVIFCVKSRQTVELRDFSITPQYTNCISKQEGNINSTAADRVWQYILTAFL
jgi:hypothetical protein